MFDAKPGLFIYKIVDVFWFLLVRAFDCQSAVFIDKNESAIKVIVNPIYNIVICLYNIGICFGSLCESFVYAVCNDSSVFLCM